MSQALATALVPAILPMSSSTTVAWSDVIFLLPELLLAVCKWFSGSSIHHVVSH